MPLSGVHHLSLSCLFQSTRRLILLEHKEIPELQKPEYAWLGALPIASGSAACSISASVALIGQPLPLTLRRRMN